MTIKIDCPACGEQVEMNVFGEQYRHNGMSTSYLSAEPVNGCDCEWTDKQEEEMEEQAIEISYQDEPPRSYNERTVEEEANADYLRSEVSALCAEWNL